MLPLANGCYIFVAPHAHSPALQAWLSARVRCNNLAITKNYIVYTGWRWGAEVSIAPRRGTLRPPVGRKLTICRGNYIRQEIRIFKQCKK